MYSGSAGNRSWGETRTSVPATGPDGRGRGPPGRRRSPAGDGLDRPDSLARPQAASGSPARRPPLYKFRSNRLLLPPGPDRSDTGRPRAGRISKVCHTRPVTLVSYQADGVSRLAIYANHFDPDGSGFRDVVQLMIDRHAEGASEADVRAAIGAFLTFTGLATESDLQRERDRIDLQSSHMIIETKRRIGTQPGFVPSPANVEQLDRYMRSSIATGHPRRLGILSDGRYWLLRVHGRPEVNTHTPYGFELRTVSDGIRLFEWLRDELGAFDQEGLKPTEEEVSFRLGTGPRFERDMATLEQIYGKHRDDPSLRVKRDLWHALLAAALGEVIEESDLDRLFLLHTYLSAVVGLAVQSAFDIDIRGEAAPYPDRLLAGEVFVSQTGIRGIVESDFFIWPAETEEGVDWVADLATRVATFDWTAADYDFARVLYQAVIPSEERRRLGEYYTPEWLALAVIEKVVPRPLGKRILDPSCGSGTFLWAAIRRYIKAASEASWPAQQVLDGLRQSVIGVDVHPVSVHLARATWVLAARELIEAGASTADLTVPVYLGDSLQLHTDNGNLLGENQVTIEVPSRTGGRHRLLQFPRSLVDQGDWFDETMLRIAETIARGHPGRLALDDANIPDGPERSLLQQTVAELEGLHREGRDHIWAYYTRNLVRPIWLSTEEGKVDAVVGNPPWLTYSQSHASLREALEKQSKELYKIWRGGRYAPHQDIAGLFFTRCVDLYLRRGGRIGMVLPHSALQTGQYQKWRTGEWSATEADLGVDDPWDLERIDPNTFFPVPSCVVFGVKADGVHRAGRMGERAVAWRGPEGGPFEFATVTLEDSSSPIVSAYGAKSSQGATVTPRRLFFVEVSEAPAALIQGLCTAVPRRGPQDREPWKSLGATQTRPLSGVLEEKHIYEIHMGETIAPFLLLEPRQITLPMSDRRQGIVRVAAPDEIYCMGGVDARTLGIRMRDRWLVMCQLWEDYKQAHNPLTLLEQLDYMGKLTSQARMRAYRLLYATSGVPTAAVLSDPRPLIDTTLYWIDCESVDEANYLATIMNSSILRQEVEGLMPKGAYGARHVHKHPWRLPIPEFDGGDDLHAELAGLGKTLRSQAALEWADVKTRQEVAGKVVSVKVARRELRAWLDRSADAERVERLVERLLTR